MINYVLFYYSYLTNTGSVVSKVEDVLLLRFPYTLYRLKNGEKLEDVSLSIPGKEKMIETDETLTVIVDDFEIEDYKSRSCRSEWDWELNVVFISAVFEPRHSPEYPSPPIIKSIHSRINLGNHDLYKTMYQSEVKDGVLMLTFRKNPQNVPRQVPLTHHFYISRPLISRYCYAISFFIYQILFVW